MTPSVLGAFLTLGLAAGGVHPVDTVDPPSFVRDAISAASDACREAGGKPIPVEKAALWSLDVNADGKLEYLFEVGANVACDGAASIFECGSSGCPLTLYEQRNGAWLTIGGIYTVDPAAIELAPPGKSSPYRELRVGCAGEPPCDEIVHYAWSKEGYEAGDLEVRGHAVSLGSIHGLRGLTRAIVVRATPAAGSPVLDRYGRDTEVIVLGEATGTPYLYVSPCNACARGFIEKSAVRPE